MPLLEIKTPTRVFLQRCHRKKKLGLLKNHSIHFDSRKNGSGFSQGKFLNSVIRWILGSLLLSPLAFGLLSNIVNIQQYYWSACTDTIIW